MQVTVQRTGIVDEVLLSGRLDGRSAGEVRDTLHAVLGSGSGCLIVDMSDLVLRGASVRVTRLLRLTRLHRVITLEPARRSVPA
jgi:anti-anti-sigma regulatory factor